MKKHYWILFFVLLFSLFSYSQNKSYAPFIPKDYDTLYEGVAKGDLNKDGIEDVVLALYHKIENEDLKDIDVDSIPPRKLIVLFGNQKKGFVKSIESSATLLCKYCGGVYGNPFEGIEVNKNVLTIYHYGGSAWRWSYTHKFQIRNGVMSLIGKAHEYYYNAEDCEKLNYPRSYEMKDENLITGDYKEIKVSDDCRLVKNKIGKQKVQSLIPLSKFTIEN
jgi:hypothetical protein